MALSIRACIVTLAAVAAVAAPTTTWACNSKAMANAGTLRSDLREVADAQYAHLAAHGSFTMVPDSLRLKLRSGFQLTIEHADSVWWTAVATFDRLPGASCRIGGRAQHTDGVPRLDEMECVIPPPPLSAEVWVFGLSMFAMVILAVIASVVARPAPSMRTARRGVIALLVIAPILRLHYDSACRMLPHPAMMAAFVTLGAYLLLRGLRGRRRPTSA